MSVLTVFKAVQSVSDSRYYVNVVFKIICGINIQTHKAMLILPSNVWNELSDTQNHKASPYCLQNAISELAVRPRRLGHVSQSCLQNLWNWLQTQQVCLFTPAKMCGIQTFRFSGARSCQSCLQNAFCQLWLGKTNHYSMRDIWVAFFLFFFFFT